MRSLDLKRRNIPRMEDAQFRCQTANGIGLGSLAEVTVVLLHLPGVGMAQLLRNEDQRNPSVDQHRGVGVAQFVEYHARDLGRITDLPHRPGHLRTGPFPSVALVLPVVFRAPEQWCSWLQPGSHLLEEGLAFRCQGHVPGFPILRELDEDRSVLRVKVLGHQAGQLGLPGAGEQAGLDQQAEVRGTDVDQAHLLRNIQEVDPGHLGAPEGPDAGPAWATSRNLVHQRQLTLCI